jgi:hypothetical protein
MRDFIGKYYWALVAICVASFMTWWSMACNQPTITAVKDATGSLTIRTNSPDRDVVMEMMSDDLFQIRVSDQTGCQIVWLCAEANEVCDWTRPGVVRSPPLRDPNQ